MRQKFLPFWLGFHLLILLFFVISLALSPSISFGTSLFDILPPTSSLHEIQKADAGLTAKTGRALTILVKSPSFESAKSAAEELYSVYVDENGAVDGDFFDSLSLYVGSDSLSGITEWLHKNRFMLLDSEARELLKAGGASEIAGDALSSAFGAFTFSDLSCLDEDPFLLSERSLRNLLKNGAVSASGMTLRDDVLACERDGDFFVLLRGAVSEKGASLTGRKSTVRNLYKHCDEILASRQNESQVEFIFSGVPFHSYENSSSARLQISLISAISLFLIVSVFLWIFRSFLPAIVSAVTVAFSCGIGFVSTLLFFRGIHVLTFVFGTTLIGTCLDYSIHYFVNWKANASCDSGAAVRKHILRGISLGFASTEICFLALFFALFPLLKQVSVFLFTGLASAYLSVVALYPMLPMPKKKKPKMSGKFLFFGALRPQVLILSVFFSIVVIFINYRSLGIKNNIQELYSMSPRMFQNEALSAQVLDTGSSGWYFILRADSEEKLLQLNENLNQFLDEGVRAQRLGNYLSLAQFIPSEKIQRESYAAAENLVPIAGEQFCALGFGSEDAKRLACDYEKNYRSAGDCLIHAGDDEIPAVIREAVSNLWLGEIDGYFYSCVLPLHVKAGEESFFREYAEKTGGVFFVSKVKDISAQLDILSRSMLLMLAIAFAVVVVILTFFYRPRLVLKIAVVPLIVTLVTMAVLLLFKIHLSFFPITALVLVFGLGLDYIIYAVEGSEKKGSENSSLNNFAILLSFVTTALSFGALAISSFPPVHMLGLTVFSGLTAAVVSALCIGRN